MPYFSDQTGHTLFLPRTPKRVVSLVPSQTELLYHLGLEHEVAGITKFCVHPQAWFRTKKRVGGTKDIKPDLIRSLSPDLIIANKEENVREQVEALRSEIPTYVSDINDLAGALQMMRDIGDIMEKKREAAMLITGIEASFRQMPNEATPIDAAYLIWRNPYMTVGGDTFINQMLQHAGFRNVFANCNRYPVILPEDLVTCGCKVVLLSSEPYPFRQQHVTELQALLPGVHLLLVDGEMFSWYGSRLLKAPPYFTTLRQHLANLAGA